jgi:hypothetical protein
MDLFGEAQNPVPVSLNVITKFRVSFRMGDVLTSWANVSFSRRTLLNVFGQFIQPHFMMSLCVGCLESCASDTAGLV